MEYYWVELLAEALDFYKAEELVVERGDYQADKWALMVELLVELMVEKVEKMVETKVEKVEKKVVKKVGLLGYLTVVKLGYLKGA